MLLTLRGRRYTLREVPRLKNWGDCDRPNQSCKTIRVWRGARAQTRLDTLIHEITHACFPDLDDEAVEQFATDTARALWRLGYRGPK